MGKCALITGITGQDGSYLAELLLAKGYEVHGIIRRCSSSNTGRLDHIYQEADERSSRMHLMYGDLNDSGSLNTIVQNVRPDEIYNLAAQSHVRTSFDIPEYTVECTGLGTVRLLEAVRISGLTPRFYQASTSEMFGKAKESPQREATAFHPRSPYGVAKLLAHWATINYRESYGVHACSGILFNHESPRRGETFVSRKITKGAARIKMGLQEKLFLGNLEAKRDWGYAPEYVEAMWRMLQEDRPEDYVIATGETHSVQEFLEETFGCLDMDWREYVEIDPNYCRPAEVDVLVGDASKARKNLGWEPKVRFKELVRRMVSADVEAIKEQGAGVEARFATP